MTDFDREKCAQRNRIAARRDGAEGVPMRLFRETTSPAAPETGVRYAQGTLPGSVEEALSRINAMLPEGAAPLAAEDVYLHYLEAANDNFIADRYAFLTDATLRNIAKDATAGVAFMNSHRDGGLSHPQDLPMGKTFAGRYEQLADGRKRALVAFYMLRGVKPNGDNAPSTDDLHRTIVGGTTQDVSIGLYGGDQVCDVCGNDVGDYEACKHDPGTAHDMTPDQQKAQIARGVTKGRASYSVDAAHMGEVSAVYDGAVPGAGFRKTLALARAHRLSRTDLIEASQAYARLLKQGDLPVDEIGELIEEHTGNALTRFFERRKGRAAQDAEADSPFATIQGLGRDVPPGNVTQAEPLLSEERQRFEQDKAAFETQRQAFARQQYVGQAELAVDKFIADGRVLPAEDQPNASGQRALVAIFAQALADDAAGTALFGQQDGSRYAALTAAYAARAPHTLTHEAIPVVTLPDTGAPPVDLAARRKELLGQSDLGRTILKQKES
jgi:hypothetical protein